MDDDELEKSLKDAQVGTSTGFIPPSQRNQFVH